ncbi:DNA-directed DNA polymerase alpha subunit pol12 [Scheffersomyces spartinae]|uniref:DNA polymerase alpha subunit B n=1 Tax=Scheffersomyces spartinae TaxID=45513 RepID=A0A9P7VCK6_9ASCO|nr:DNA-directed DNA polymerase alpha subunit pol12 [Scheffersomyces spartinae]KAG7195320.1 DNA-directed DNA polymerase alpha subunit pol12 [Scheffersomyces spartinae]
MTVDNEFRKEVSNRFGSSSSLTDEVYEKIEELKSTFNCSVEDVFVQWEAYNVTEAFDDLELNIGNLSRLAQFMQTSLSSKNIKTTTPARKLKDARVTRNLNHASSPLGATPTHKKRKTEAVASSPNGSGAPSSVPDYSSPTKPTVESHTILETLNDTVRLSEGYVQLQEDASTSIKPFLMIANYDAAKYKFRTMQMKLLESADVLDEQIDNATQLFQDATKSPEGEPIQISNPCLPSQFEVYTCGRIVPDSPAYNLSQSLNKSSLYLETSRFTGIGQRIPLDLTQISGYSFFPGQIVILKGKNPSGSTFVVSEVFPLPNLPSGEMTREEVNQYKELYHQTGLKIVVLSGPYSNSHSLDFSKFESFMIKLNDEIMPHLVICHGPFIDLNNECIKSGSIPLEDDNSKQNLRNLDEVFTKFISPIFKRLNSRILVVLIPSVRDSVATHCSYPQDVFDRKSLGLPKNVHVHPNPSSFSINDVLIANSNLDIFKDIKEVFSPGDNVSSDRFLRVTKHILQQRRYYPLFPGSKNNSRFVQHKDSTLFDGALATDLVDIQPGGSNLEVPYLPLTEVGEIAPDIMVIPSELKYFARIVDGVVTVNPGSYIKHLNEKGNDSGSYAIISVEAPSLDSLEESEDSLFFKLVDKRTRVDFYHS